MALIAQMARASGMNPKAGGSSPPQGETFFVSNLWNFHKKSVPVPKMNAVGRAQLAFQMFTLL